MDLAASTALLREAGINAINRDTFIEIIEYSEESWILYHVLPWSADPEVPVLYFQGFTNEDTPIQEWGGQSEENVSKTVHPINHMSFWFVHPCNTRSWLETMCPRMSITDPEVLVLWFKGLKSKVNA